MPGKKFLQEVSSDALDLADEKYKVRPAATSGRANSPEGRLQLAFELRQMGILSDAGFAAAQSGFDVPEELEDRDTQREWLEHEIERWLFADDEEVEKPEFYRAPLKHMDLPAAVARVVDGLLEAQIDGLEEDRLEFFLLFLSDCDALLAQKAAAMPPPDAAAGTLGIAKPQLAATPGTLAGLGPGAPRQLRAPGPPAANLA